MTTEPDHLEQLVQHLSGKQASLPVKVHRGLALLQHYSWLQMSIRAKKLLAKRLFGEPKIRAIDSNQSLAEPLALCSAFSTSSATGSIGSDLESSFFEDTVRLFGERIGVTSSASVTSSAGASSANPSPSAKLELGEFCLLERPIRLGPPSEWQTSIERLNSKGEGPSHLWRFQLHYQEYLLAAVAESADSPSTVMDEVWRFVVQWIEAYDPTVEAANSDNDATINRIDAWHPYCISRRIPAWITLLAIAKPKDDQLAVILRSLATQIEHLQANLEFDLGGNHLLENLFAISIAGLCIAHPLAGQWITNAETQLTSALNKQVLPHGEHFELSPMYHCQITAQLLRIAKIGSIVGERGKRLETICLEHAKRMVDFVNSILHPDGEIPLFGDSGFGEAPSLKEISWLAKQNGIQLDHQSPGMTQVGGYFVFRSDDSESSSSEPSRSSVLLCDFGEVAANNLPAHGHCDLLGLEGSIEGRRWLVDSGNFNYESDSMRRFCRSSMAHNVMTIGGIDQCDVWSKFRMGDRGHVSNVSSGAKDDWNFARAGHNAYRKLGVHGMERLVAVHLDQLWLCADFANGQIVNNAPLKGYLHFAPDLEIRNKGVFEFELSLENATRRLRFFGCSHARVVTGWYCESFGQRTLNRVIEYKQDAYQNVPIGWVLEPTRSDSEIELSTNSMQISANGKVTHWRF